MPLIQAGTDPNIPYPRHTFWFWETVNILVPLIGILFLDWHIFTLVLFFWWELLCWGAIGILKILSANGAPTFLSKITTRIGGVLFFSILFFGLFLILFSYSYLEFDSEAKHNIDRGLKAGMAAIAINFLVEFFRSEIATGRFLKRHPLEIVAERLLYAMPLTMLVVLAVIPLSQKFEGEVAVKAIGVGIITSKFLMDVAMHYLPGMYIFFHGDTVGNRD